MINGYTDLNNFLRDMEKKYCVVDKKEFNKFIREFNYLSRICQLCIMLDEFGEELSIELVIRLLKLGLAFCGHKHEGFSMEEATLLKYYMRDELK